MPKKNKKTIPLTRNVLVEKSSAKYFIRNSEIFLNSKGIGIYIFLSVNNTHYQTQRTYASVVNYYNLNQLIKLYNVNVLYKFYKTLTSNDYLENLSDLNFNLAQKSKQAFLTSDFHHTKYLGNKIKDEFGNFIDFKIYCMNSTIIKKAGYSEFPYPDF